MRFSQFNIIVPDSGYYIIYNTLSRALARIQQSSYTITNQELKETGFIIEDDDDEKISYLNFYLKNLYEYKTPIITITTTQKCNLNCHYCFEGINKSLIDLSLETCDAIINLIKGKYAKGVRLIWFGGEPMLNLKAIEYISEKLSFSSIPFDATIITNGTIIPTHFIDNLKKYHISTIQITLDGDKECHNAKRHFRDGIGTFDLILRNITRILDSRESDVIVKINLDHNNLSTFPVVKQFLLERFNNDPLLTVSHNFIRNRTNFKDNGTCLTDLDYFDFFYEPKDAERILSNFVGPCPLRISNHIVISANGDIQKCLEQVGDSNHAIGNVNASVISVKKSSFYKLFSLPFTREDCKLCSILPLCGGGCPMDILKNGQPICNALKYRIQQVVKDYYLYHTK